VQVFDAGETDGQYYIAMEYVDGSNLLQYAEKKHPIPETEGLNLLLQAARGLGAAHAKGLVHRDVKPENLLIGGDGILRVVDFGLVADQASTTQLTATGACLGTPMYMSPEQADGEQADARTDVYSLGVTFFRVMTGQPAFTSGTLVNLLYKHKFETPPDPRGLRKDMSESARNLILRMMAKRREDRPANGQAVAELAEAALSGKAVDPPPPGSLIANDKPVLNASSTNFESIETSIKPYSLAATVISAARLPRNRKKLAIAGFAALLALVVIVIVVLGGGPLARAKKMVLQQREQEALAEIVAGLKGSPGDETLLRTKSALTNLQTVLSQYAELLKHVQVAADRVRSVQTIDDDDRAREFATAYNRLTARIGQRPSDVRAMFAEDGHAGVEKAAVLLKNDASELHTSFTAAAVMCEQKAEVIQQKKGLGSSLPWQRTANRDKADALRAFGQEYKKLAEQVKLLKN
jgi:hypothetical protein